MSNSGSLRNFALGAKLPPLSSVADRPGSSCRVSFSEASDEDRVRLPPGALLDYFVKGEFDVATVQELLEAVGVDLNMSEPLFGWTPLLFAANHGSAQLLDILVYAGAFLNVACRQGNVALHLAARAGHCQAVDCLIVNKADLDVRNGNGWTALAWSAINGRANVASRLLEAAADLAVIDSEGRTPSMWAARHGHFSVIQSLLNVGFDLNVRDSSGLSVMDHATEHLELWFALHAAEKVNVSLFDAIKSNDIQAVITAIQARAHVNAFDADGWTPLLWAACCGSPDVVKLLVQAGGSTFAGLQNADTCELKVPALRESLRRASQATEQLLVAAKTNDWLLFEESLSDGAWVNVTEAGTLRSPLMWAALNGVTEMSQALVSAKAQVEQRDTFGWTPLNFGVGSRSCELVTCLLGLRADMSTTTYDGESPLHLASRFDDPAMVRTLINEQCDLEVQSNEALTPVQVAARCGAASALGTLIKYGADSSVKDSHKRSLLGMAVVHGHLSVARRLLIPSAVSKKGQSPKESKQHEPASQSPKESQQCKPACQSPKESKQLEPACQPEKESKQREPSCQSSKESKQREEASPCSPQVVGSGRRVVPSPAEASKEHKDVTPAKNKRKCEQKAGSKKLSTEADTPEKVNRSKPGKVKHGLQPLEDSKSRGSPKETRTKSHEPEATPEKHMQMETPEKPKHNEKAKPQDGATSEKKLCASTSASSIVTSSSPKREILSVCSTKPKAKKAAMTPEKLIASKDRKGRTALSLAVQFGVPDILTLLLKLSPDLNAVDAQGNTALMLAADRSSYAAVDHLLHARAAVGLRNKSGKSALDLAGDPNIRQLLNKFWIESKVSRLEKSRRVELPGPGPASNLGFRLRVEGLPVTLTEDILEMQLRNMLRRFTNSNAFHVEVMVAPISSRPRGYAYITCMDGSDAEAAMLCDGSLVGDCTVRVFRELVP